MKAYICLKVMSGFLHVERCMFGQEHGVDSGKRVHVG